MQNCKNEEELNQTMEIVSGLDKDSAPSSPAILDELLNLSELQLLLHKNFNLHINT